MAHIIKNCLRCIFVLFSVTSRWSINQTERAAGHVMAAALRTIKIAVDDKGICSARLSIARTAELLISYLRGGETIFKTEHLQEHFSSTEETTPWGSVKPLPPALDVIGVPMKWSLAASKLGSEVPSWN
jgi:hypothetical protein